MADYWKSQPRKFCQYCKCWIADNKPSVEFHERGKNHKENVAAKISEIKKKSVDKAKQEAKASKEFAAMEEAALKAYEEDLKRMGREAAGLDSPPRITTPAKPQRKLVVINQVKNPPKKQKKHHKANRTPRDQIQTQVWVEGQTNDGSKYYYNTITGESRWEKPKGFQGESSTSYQPGRTESSPGCPWMEAVSPEGHTYYYNSETGESTWEKPANLPSNKASEPNAEGKSQEALTTQAGEEKTSNGPSASEKFEVPAEASQQCSIPKINFMKRKAEDEPTGKESKEAISKVAEETKKGEVQSKTAESEKKGEEVPRKAPQARRLRTANPYGAWERIKEEVDPYANVDLQLPQLEGCSASVPADLPPEPKPKFKERVITSLGDGEEGGPTSFRKSKTQNGKARCLRQRDDDD